MLLEILLSQKKLLAKFLLGNGDASHTCIMGLTYTFKMTTIFVSGEKFIHAQIATICQAHKGGDNNGVYCGSTWSNANRTRCVTKIRRVVVSSISRQKQ